jgi:hypothetical protein
MRAANGKLLLAENANGRIPVLTINGDKASVTVLKDGLDTPIGCEITVIVLLALWMEPGTAGGASVLRL